MFNALKYFNVSVVGQFSLSDDLHCSPVNQVMIPSKVDTCSDEVFVFFVCNSTTTGGLLSRISRISLATESQIRNCSEEFETYIDNEFFAIERVANLVKVTVKTASVGRKIYDFLRSLCDDKGDYFLLGVISLLLLSLVVVVTICCVQIRKVRPQKRQENKLSAVKQAPQKRDQCEIEMLGGANPAIYCNCEKGQCKDNTRCTCRKAGRKCNKLCHGTKKIKCFNK